MKTSSIILSLSQISTQKTSHLFKSHQRDKSNIIVQSDQNCTERKLFQKVFSDQHVSNFSE
jgi:hypothetical protein